MQPKRTGVYIDGLNLYHGALKETPYKWLDPEALVRHLLPLDDIVHIRYFTALVNVRRDDPRIQTRHATYLRALSSSNLITIHRGRFTTRVKSRALADAFEPHDRLFSPRFRPNSLYSMMWRDKVRRRTDSVSLARVVIEEEKGSDVNLGAYLVNDAARAFIDKALVVSNDSDLTEAIRLAQGFGTLVGTVNPHSAPTSKHLRSVSSFEIPLRPGVLARSQFANTVIDRQGREIHKPREWRETQRPGLAAGPWAHLPKCVSGMPSN